MRLTQITLGKLVRIAGIKEFMVIGAPIQLCLVYLLSAPSNDYLKHQSQTARSWDVKTQ